MYIPKIIHRIWLGPNPLPERYAIFGQSWQEHHPGWKLELWTEERIESLLQEDKKHSDIYTLYQAEPTYAGKSDIARLVILYRFGGVYVDTDFECLQNIEPLIDGETVFAMTGWTGTDELMAANGLMGCTAEHLLFKQLLDGLADNVAKYKDRGLFYKYGGHYIDASLQVSDTFVPYLLPRSATTEPLYGEATTPETYAVHYADGKINHYTAKTAKIDFFANARHYFDHLAPIWHALPECRRGKFYAHHNPHDIVGYARQRGVQVTPVRTERDMIKTPEDKARLMVIAGLTTISSRTGRPFALLNHGVGQTYTGDKSDDIKAKSGQIGPIGHSSYSGGPGRARIELFLNPNRRAYDIDRQAYPDAKHALVGCPKMDVWFDKFNREPWQRRDPPVIATSFHFDCRVAPEARGSYPYFAPALELLAAEAKQGSFKILGHGHPRLIDELTPVYTELGIEVVRDFERVLAEVDLYICDNSSTLYEFAATGRPVVVLNAPWYRRDVEHGLRFWEHADVGVNCNSPDELLHAVEEALQTVGEREAAQRLRRQEIVKALYPIRDGTAAKQAVAIIAKTADRLQTDWLKREGPVMIKMRTTTIWKEKTRRPGDGFVVPREIARRWVRNRIAVIEE